LKKIFIVLIFLISLIFVGCSYNEPRLEKQVADKGKNLAEKNEVKLSSDEVLELLIKSHKSEDSRPNKGYSFDGINSDSGYYMFSWSNPGKGTGASFEVDPYTGDVYSMGIKTSSIFDSSKENKPMQ
jgi:hypothetical protein